MSDDEPTTPGPRRKRKPTMAQTMGGVIFGFEQQVWRTAPPPQELVHHARPMRRSRRPTARWWTIEPPTTMTEAAEDEEPKR